MKNQEIAKALSQIADLLEIKGEKQVFKIRAYRKASLALENLKDDIEVIYKQKGLAGLEKISGIGKSIALKIEEYLKKGKIKLLGELEQETAIRQVIAYFFESKGLDLKQLKEQAKKEAIVYSRYTKPAKQLIELSGGVQQAKKAIEKVALWASSRNLDYTIETVFKKWLEIDQLKPKEVVKKPFYEGLPMIFSDTKKKWFVVNNNGEWLEFADKEDKIEWKITK
ncbi:MAG: helix-hairpin-helix domain-containing protein [Candidatus Pacebacteria bacterium]|nr:helix-hairpin-helix domain-containing protein [Candidatus Paceibacterota bacterium]